MFRVRMVAVLAVVGSLAGAVLMFIAGLVSTWDAYVSYFDGDAESESHSEGTEATVELISALDQFLFGLILLFFAYGVFVLFVSADTDNAREQRERAGVPSWMDIKGIGELKAKLLEVIIVLFAVQFLKSALTDGFVWQDFVVPATILALGLVVWLMRDSERRGH